MLLFTTCCVLLHVLYSWAVPTGTGAGTSLTSSPRRRLAGGHGIYRNPRKVACRGMAASSGRALRTHPAAVSPRCSFSSSMYYLVVSICFVSDMVPMFKSPLIFVFEKRTA